MKNLLILLSGIIIGIVGVMFYGILNQQDEIEIEYRIPNEIIMELEFYRHNHDRLVKGIEGESE